MPLLTQLSLSSCLQMEKKKNSLFQSEFKSILVLKLNFCNTLLRLTILRRPDCKTDKYINKKKQRKKKNHPGDMYFNKRILYYGLNNLQKFIHV